MKKVVDLSHSLHKEMPTYPGDDSPNFEINKSLLELNIFVTKLKITTHLGTHLDCPSHLGDKPIYASEIPVENFIGEATVVDVRNHIINNEIQASFLNSRYLEFDYLLLYTQTDKLWGKEEYFTNAPYLSNELANILANSTIKGIGIDAGSVDKANCLSFSAHHSLLECEKVIVENLTNLENLIGQEFLFIALPLKIKFGDGSPIRAVAYINK